MQRRARRNVLAAATLLAMAATSSQAFLFPPTALHLSARASAAGRLSSSSAALAPLPAAALIDAPVASSTRRVRRRAPAPEASPLPTSSPPALADAADAVMHTRVKAVQRAALAIQKQRNMAKELGRAPSMAEWGQALGGITEDALRRVLERGSVARADLVKGWDALVAKFVNKYARTLSDSELQDLVVEGQLGVVEAAVRFEGGQGAGFKTYVYYWVRKRVMDAAAVYDRSTFGGVHEARQASQIKKAVAEHERASGGQLLSTGEIAAKVGLPVARVEELSRRGQRYGLMEQALMNGGGSVTFLDTLQDTQAITDQGSVLESMYLAEVEEAVRGALARLPEEERVVLSHRLGLQDGQPKGWEELARLMDGCSVSYLRKVEAKAKTHLRRNVEVVKLIHRRPASFDDAFFGL